MPPGYEELQVAPPDERLQAVAAAIGAGLRVTAARRLRGGIDNGMHVLELDGGVGGQPKRVVLRRYSSHTPAAVRAQKEFRLLQAAQSAGIPSPEPLLLDAGGEIAGSPAIVTSFIDGRPLLVPSEAPSWPEQVAAALWSVHRAVKASDVQFLGPAEGIDEAIRRQCADTARFTAHPLGMELREAMLKAVGQAVRVQPTLIHGDYWAGNTLWRGGKLIAVVDWDDAKISDPAADVGYMWMDLMVLGEREAAEEFVAEYERRLGQPLPNLRLSQLLGLSRPLPDPARWFVSWEGSGRTDITPESVRRNFSETIRTCVG